MKIPFPSSLAMLCFVVALCGCQSDEAATSTDPSNTEAPEGLQMPEELHAKWQKTDKTQTIEFLKNGECKLENKINMAGVDFRGGSAQESSVRKFDGTWGTKGEELYLSVKDQPVVQYKFSMDNGQLVLAAGKYKTKYNKL